MISLEDAVIISKKGTSEPNAARSWLPGVRAQLRRVASRMIETFSPKLGWRLKVRHLRRNIGEYEMQIAPFLCDIHKTSVDVGADHGSYSVTMCDHSANCIAFEPRPVQAARIRNMALASGLRIDVEAVALSDSVGTACLRVLTKDLGRSTIESANSLEDSDGSPRTSIRVPKMRLDDYELRDVALIKIDVEGHELAVLRGAQKTIAASMPSLLVEIEERHHSGNIKDVSTFLTGLGYKAFFLLDGEVLPLTKFDSSVHQDPANISGWKDGWERHGVYINNFFFLPASNIAVLSTAVSSVNHHETLPKAQHRN